MVLGLGPLLLNSVLGAYYYLRVLVFMYMREPAPGAAVAHPMRSGYVATALVVSAVLVLALGMWPSSALRMAVEAALFDSPPSDVIEEDDAPRLSVL